MRGHIFLGKPGCGDALFLIDPAEIKLDEDELTMRGEVLFEDANHQELKRVTIVVTRSVEKILKNRGSEVAHKESISNGLTIFVARSIFDTILSGKSYGTRWNYRPGAHFTIELEGTEKHITFESNYEWALISDAYHDFYKTPIGQKIDITKLSDLLQHEKLKLLHGSGNQKVIDAISSFLEYE